MPIEHLWRWLREEVTCHNCYASKADLIQQVKHFEQRINDDSLALTQRVWIKTELISEVEKLRVST